MGTPEHGPAHKKSRTRKIVAGLALGAVAFGGGIVGGAGLGSTLAVADDAVEAVEERTGWVADALSGLVADDVITQDQSDAVVDALREARPDRGEMLDRKRDAWQERAKEFGANRAEGREDRAESDDTRDRSLVKPRHRHGAGFAMDGLDALTDTLGVTRSELIESVMSGDSIADIAEANDVDLQDVIDSLTAQANERIDAAVEAGRLDEARADEMRTRAQDAVEAAVNGSIADLGSMKRDDMSWGKKGMKPGDLGRGFGHRGFGQRDDSANGEEGS